MGLEGTGTAEVRGDAVRSDADRRDAADRSGVDAARNPLADVRPVTVGAVLDGGVELLRHRFGRLVALTACLFIPVWLLTVVLSVLEPPRGAAGEQGLAFDAWGAFGATSSPLVYLVLVLQLVALSVLGLCVGRLGDALARGEDVSLRELGRLVLRRGWVAALVVPLNAVVQAPGVCLGGVGWVFGDALVMCTSVVAGAERRGPWGSFTRGLSLTWPSYGRMLVVALGSLCLTQLIRLSLSTGPTVLAESLLPGSVVAGLVAALSSAVLVLTQPLTACIALRAYLDLRCRRDGLDLELRHERLRAEQLGAAA